MSSSHVNGDTSRMLIAEIKNNERENKNTFLGSFGAQGWVSVFECIFTLTGFHSNTTFHAGKV